MGDQMWVDIERAKEVVERVLISAQNGEGIYERGIIQPELPLISALIKDGESTYTPALLRNGLFLTCSMIFATRTEAFMKRLADPESFSRFSWLYNPEAVTEWDPIQVENACREYMSPGGHQLNAIAGWYQNCTTLVERYSGDILNFLKESNFNAVDVVEQMMDERKSGFVRFGRKLSTLFVIWAQKHNIAHFSDFDKIAIPIDFQVDGTTRYSSDGLPSIY